MTTASEARSATYARICPWLRESFGDLLVERPDDVSCSVLIGSALTQILVLPWGTADSLLVIRSYVVTGARLDADLMRFLLEANARVRFGAFGLDGEGDIFFQQTLLGSTCDPQELRVSTMSVAAVADEFDDRIVERWGGSRALDTLR